MAGTAKDGPDTVGCLLVLTASLRPVRYHGDPARPAGRGTRYMVDEAEGEVSSICDRMIAGELANIDLILLPRAIDAAAPALLNCRGAPVGPQARVPEVVLVDAMQTAF